MLLLAVVHTGTYHQPFHLTTTEVAFAVPIGVVIASFISFLSLRWSTNKSIQAQQRTLTTTLEAERKRTDATLEAERRRVEVSLEAERERTTATLEAEQLRADATLTAQRELAEITAEAQRSVAADNRLFEKRVETFLPMLENIRIMIEDTYFPRSTYKEQGNWVASTTALLRKHLDFAEQTQTTVLAYGRQDVRFAFSTYIRDLRHAWLEVDQGFSTADKTTEELLTSALRLRDALRSGLSSEDS